MESKGAGIIEQGIKEVTLSPERNPYSPHITLFIGPEGSGKSTQGRLFADRYKLPFIEVGQAFRDLKDSYKNHPTELGRKTSELVGYSDLDLFKDVIRWRFEAKTVRGIKVDEDYSKGFVLDGAPRTLEQFEHFEEFMREMGFEYPIRVAFLHVPKSESLKRLEKRGQRVETASDRERLDQHYRGLDKKIKTIKQRGWEFHTVVTQTGHSKTENLVEYEVREKLGLLNPNWREIVDLEKDLYFEEVCFDIASAPGKDKLRRVVQYLENIRNVSTQTSSTGEWFEQMISMRDILIYKEQQLRSNE